MPDEYFKFDKTLLAFLVAATLQICTGVWWASNANARIVALEANSPDKLAIEIRVLQTKIENMTSAIVEIKTDLKGKK